MSRLADAESKLAAALKALEAAITSTSKDEAPSNGMPDSTMIISEIGRIDAQLAQALELLADTDIVLDCSDNYAARFAINDACLALNVPAIFGAATAWQGQVFVSLPDHAASPCYECFNPSREELDASCARNGILGPVVGVIASQQAVEAMRVLLGMSFSPVLQLYDARDSEWHRIAMAPRASCPCRSK